MKTSANPGGNWKAQSAVDINRRMVFSACEMGVGREAIAVMCEILNMPPPCQTEAWSDHSQALYKAHKDAVDEKLAKARANVHELRRKENPDLNEDDDIEIAVSFDGTWSKRGFTANFGIGFVISADSGQVLDYGFASKISVQCSRKNKNFLKTLMNLEPGMLLTVHIVLRITPGPVVPWKRTLPGEFGAIPSATISVTNL